MTRISQKASTFTESVIREMTRMAIEHEAINLAQGFPDFACPRELKDAAKRAIDADINQYAITWGAKSFRDGIAAKTSSFYDSWLVDPEREITVTCGATEGMISSMLSVIDPGDEVILFEPFYENYGPDAILSGAIPKYVTLHEPDWSIDERQLEAAFTDRTRGIVINSPHNPTGKVFTREELELIGRLCEKWDVMAFTDEIYEHILYEGTHIPMATVEGMRERTVAINALSKTYSVTGWRVGWVIASAEITSGVRKVHDFLTVGAAAPLQEAGAVAMRFPRSYYKKLAVEYLKRRNLLLEALEESGFKTFAPDGAYYVMTDIRGITSEDDMSFAKRMIVEAGIAAVPGSSFYSNPELGRHMVRFGFPKKIRTLEAAAKRFRRANLSSGG